MFLKAIAYASGLFNPKTRDPINITLYPTSISKDLFKEIVNLQIHLQLLYYNLSLDLDSYSLEDKLSRYLKSIKSNKNKKIKALYLRSDYLPDSQEGITTYKQVEINTISQCFSIFVPIVNRIHSINNKKTFVSSSDLKFIEFLKTLKKEYENVYSTTNTVIVMVDNDTTSSSSNFLERMKIIEMAFKENIRVYHILLEEIDFQLEKIFYKGEEISIVYYRWYYNYDQYTSKAKSIRKQLEDSIAISLPSAEFQIVNSKTFQRILSVEENIKKYSKENFKKYFGEFKSPEGAKVPEGWILKDVEEGGGYLNKPLSNTSFLMKKFNSPTTVNAFLSDEKEREIISEISIFGGLIVVEGKIVYNKEGGYMVRSKDKDSLEGGVCVGAEGLNSLILE